MSMSQFIPVAIMGFGHNWWLYHEEILTQLEHRVGKERFVKIDLRVFLNDPHNKLRDHPVKGDGSNAFTQVAVFCQPEIVETIKHCCDKLIKKLKELAALHEKRNVPLSGVIIGGGCNGSSHRADVIRRAMAEILNSVKFDGERVFNAMDFNLLHCKDFEERAKKLSKPKSGS